MKKTSIAAVNRILNGKSHFCEDRTGFWFEDTTTGKIGVTDSYCCVMYDYNIDLSNFDTTQSPYLTEEKKSPFPTNVSKLFDPFNNEFHEWYSDDRMENILVKDVIDMAKQAKKNSKDDPNWYHHTKGGVTFNINLMRDVCEALDSKTVGIYYPMNPYDAKFYKPIVIIGENGVGLVMQMRY